MSTKARTSTLIGALKTTLKSRSITYEELARRLKLSHPSVKRLFAEETFTLKRIEEICHVLEIDFFDLARMARGASADTDEMTQPQEEALAQDARLLGMFYLVFNEWSMDEILDAYELSKAECTKLLLQLDKLRLIELGANNAVRLRVPKTLRLQRNGPIRRSHGKSVVSDFLQADFAEMGGFFRFEFRDLSRASVAHLERKLERIAHELHELAELDGYLPPDQRQTVGLALGMRPWTMSWVTGLKKKTVKNKNAAIAVKGRA
ncbi:MAG: helix-turn-helix transcriptional regulator [Betaproteobacteria bacterium]